MIRTELVKAIQTKGSYLCVGLDTDIEKIPSHLRSNKNAVFEFNKQIIDSTKDFAVAYKLNTAFYEARGIKGWQDLEQTVDYIPKGILRIADAKRADIGNTSAQYARAFFETFSFDAITVSPYMGEDSLRPFLEYENKWTIILGLTSNPGAADFELKKVMHEWDDLEEGIHVHKHQVSYLYERVIEITSKWGTPNNQMYVIGATQASEFSSIRQLIPNHFLLVPGVGAQGGSLNDISEKAMTTDCGLLVNASRAIIYASEKEDFAQEARAIAEQYQHEMNNYLKRFAYEPNTR